MPPSRGSIFRQAALDRLSSPEQMDTLMRVLSPAGWLALLAVGFLLAVALAWGVLGRIPVHVSGDGVLLRSGGIFVVASTGAGEVSSLEVSLGDRVERGQVVARLAQPELTQQLADARKHLAELQAQAAELSPLEERDATLSARSLDYQRAAAEATLETLRSEVERLERKVEAQEKLVADGVITEDTLAQARIDLAQARSQVIAGEADVDRLKSERAKSSVGRESAREERAGQIEQAADQVTLLEQRLSESAEVVAAQAGRVVEIMAAAGEPVAAGGPIVGIERSGSDGNRLQLIAYVSALDAYKIAPGMKVQVVPSVVKKEEYGSMLGTVVSVAEIPADEESMMRVLGNQPLVTRLSENGVPIEVRSELALDPATPSGYRWTSAAGPPLRVHDGTLCSVSVVVREQAPITLAIPGLEKALGF